MLFPRYSQRPCPSLTSHHCCRFCSCWAAASLPRQQAHPARPRPRSRESCNGCRGQSSVARSRPPGSSIVRRRPTNPMRGRLPTALTARPRPRQAKRNVEQRLPAARHGRLQRRQRLLRGRHRKQRSSQRRAITPCPASPRGAGAPRPRPSSAAAADRSASAASQIANRCRPGPGLTPPTNEPSRCVP